MNKQLKAACDQADYYKRAYEIERERRLKAAEERKRDMYTKIGDAAVVAIYSLTAGGWVWLISRFVEWCARGW